MTISDEPVLLDTNVLVYAADASSPFHDAARHLRDHGVRGDGQVHAVPPHRMTYPVPDLLRRVLALHAQHPYVARQDIFDLALVATMLANRITRIYTYNQQHFTPFHELMVLPP